MVGFISTRTFQAMIEDWKGQFAMVRGIKVSIRRFKALIWGLNGSFSIKNIKKQLKNYEKSYILTSK